MRAGFQNNALLLASERSTASPHWVIDICQCHLYDYTNLICASLLVASDSIRPSVNHVVLQRVPHPVYRVYLNYIMTVCLLVYNLPRRAPS